MAPGIDYIAQVFRAFGLSTSLNYEANIYCINRSCKDFDKRNMADQLIWLCTYLKKNLLTIRIST